MIRPKDEQGAIAVMAAVCMIFVTGAVALSVDVGKMTFSKRHVQSLADVIALDAVRAVGDLRDPLRDPMTVAREFATSSAQRNNFDPAAPGNTLTVELGVADPDTRIYVPIPSGGVLDPANAVKVTISTAVPHAFLPGSTSVSNSAIAVAGPAGSNLIPPSPTPSSSPSSPTSSPSPAPSSSAGAEGGLSVGSYLSRIDTSQSSLWNALLGALTGGNVSLTAASYSALADPRMTVNVGSFLAELSTRVGSPDQVATGSVALSDVLAAEAAVAGRSGASGAGTASTALNALAANAALGGQTVRIADLLAVSGASGSVASANVNALQLALMAVEAANGSNLLTFSLPVSIPGVGSVSMSLSFLEAPSIGIGPAGVDGSGNWLTQAHTAQARMRFVTTLSQTVSVAGVAMTVTVPMYVDGGRGTAALASTSCASGVSDSATGVQATTSAMNAYVGSVSDTAMRDRTTAPTVSPATFARVAGVAQVTGSGSASVSGATANLAFPWPYSAAVPPFDPSSPPPPQTVGAPASDVLTTLAANTTATGAALGLGVTVSNTDLANVLTAVRSAITGVSSTIATVMQMLGLDTSGGSRLGGADVTNFMLSCPAAGATPSPSPSSSSSAGGGGGSGGGSSGSSSSDQRHLIG